MLVDPGVPELVTKVVFVPAKQVKFVKKFGKP